MKQSIIDGLISDQQLQRFADLIYDATGIRISPKKKSLITNRLRRRLRANGLDCFDQYYAKIERLVKCYDNPEWNAFLESITTHETYLYRDENQWRWFANSWIAQMQRQAENGERDFSLRIWSAACSRGDEAYTMACCLANSLKDLGKWKIDILGTDIGVETLTAARRATFNEQAMRKVPKRLMMKLFDECGPDQWRAKESLQKWVRFEQHNLIQPLNESRPFDLICLKNVMIYFDPKSKEVVMGHLYDKLKMNGYLMIGPAEGVTKFVQRYERIDSLLYQKAKQLPTTGAASNVY